MKIRYIRFLRSWYTGLKNSCFVSIIVALAGLSFSGQFSIASNERVEGWVDSPLLGKRRMLSDRDHAGVTRFVQKFEAYSDSGIPPQGTEYVNVLFEKAIRIRVYGTWTVYRDDNGLARTEEIYRESPGVVRFDKKRNAVIRCNLVLIEKVKPHSMLKKLPVGKSMMAKIGSMPGDLLIDAMTIPFSVAPEGRSKGAVHPRVLLVHLGEQYGAGMLSHAVSWRLVDRGLGWPGGDEGESAAIEVAERLKEQCLESPFHLRHGWCLLDLAKLAKNSGSEKIEALLREVEQNANGIPKWVTEKIKER